MHSLSLPHSLSHSLHTLFLQVCCWVGVWEGRRGGAAMQFYRLAKVLPGPQNLAFVLGGADFWGAKRTALKIVLVHTPYQCLLSIQGIF